MYVRNDITAYMENSTSSPPASTRTIVITKAAMLDAIRNEPLLISGSYAEPRSDGTCAVCAVGAVLRSAVGVKNATDVDKLAFRLMSTWIGSAGGEYNDFDDLRAGAAYYTQRERWWTALSHYFESLVSNMDYSIEDARHLTCKFVESQFPESLTIEVPL